MKSGEWLGWQKYSDHLRRRLSHVVRDALSPNIVAGEGHVVVHEVRDDVAVAVEAVQLDAGLSEVAGRPLLVHHLGAVLTRAPHGAGAVQVLAHLLAVNDAVHCEDGEWQESRYGDEPADDVCPKGELVRAVGGRHVLAHDENKHSQRYDGGGEDPHEAPVRPDRAVEPDAHLGKVVQEAVAAVDPGDDDDLGEADEEDGPGRRVPVQQGEHVHASRVAHGDLHDEAAHAGAQRHQPLPLAERRPLVDHRRGDGLDPRELAAEPEDEEHEEEEHGPDLRRGHAEDRLRVHDEGEARARVHDLGDGHALLVRQEAHDGEDGEAGEHGRAQVRHGDDQGVGVAVVGELAVGRQRDEGAAADAERVEHLRGGVPPHVGVAQDLPARRDVVETPSQAPSSVAPRHSRMVSRTMGKMVVK